MLLNKKRGLLVLSSLFLALLIPIVSAQYEGVYSMFSFLFGAGDDGSLMLLKAGVWIILFAIIFWLAKKMFSGSKGIATIFSIVVSLISIRFIPDEYIYYIGSAYGVFGIIVLILAIIGGTLLILNSYFPIKEHKAFGVVWALFYFFIAWVFHQLTDIITGIYQVDELMPVIGPWGKWVCIVLGIICLLRAFSGKSKYTREMSIDKREDEKPPSDDRDREERDRDDRNHETMINDVDKWEKLIKELRSDIKVLNQKVIDLHGEANELNDPRMQNILNNNNRNVNNINNRLNILQNKIEKFENNSRVDKGLEKYIKVELNNIFNITINVEKQVKEETKKIKHRGISIHHLKDIYQGLNKTVQQGGKSEEGKERTRKILREMKAILRLVKYKRYNQKKFLAGRKNGGMGERAQLPRDYVSTLIKLGKLDEKDRHRWD